MKIGFLGTGSMGRPMAARLLAAGHALTVYNRTRQKAEELVKLGARVASSPAECVAGADGVVVMVRDAAAVRELLLGEGVDLHGSTVLQMSTIAPVESIALAGEVRARGGAFLEAPVSGSTPQAEQGTLLVMVGGDRELFERWSGVLGELGPDPVYAGAIGNASTLKLALNQLLAAMTAGFALSFGLVERRGVDPELFMALLHRSSLASPLYEARYPRMRARDFSAATFALELLLKDIDLARAEASRLGLDTTALDGIRQLAAGAVERGLGRLDASALYAAVAPQGGAAATG